MPDPTGQMVEFRTEDTEELLFLGKLYAMPTFDQRVLHEGDEYKVERVIWTLTEDPRIQYCTVQPAVFLTLLP